MEKLNILIGSPDIYQRQMFTAFFMSQGHTVTSCGSGREATTEVKRRFPTDKRINAAFLNYTLIDINAILLGDQLKKIDDNIILIMFPAIELLKEEVARAFHISGGFYEFPGTVRKSLDYYHGLLQRIVDTVSGKTAT